MYYRRTLNRHKNVVPARATNSTAPWCRSMGLIVAVITLLMLTGPGLLAQPVDGSDDGLTAEERSAVYREISQTTRDNSGYRAILIVDSTAKNAVLGMYQLRHFGQPSWSLFGRTIEWAIDHKDHAATRIWLATYLDGNGTAAYEHLVDSMGFNPDSIHVAHPATIVSADFTGYDLALYIRTHPVDVQNVLDQGVPYITTSIGQAEQMGIGAGDYYLHESRDFVWIQDADHEITAPHGLGLLTLQQSSYINATVVSGNGVVLVSADSTVYQPPVAIEIEQTVDVDFGSIVTIDITRDDASYWYDMAGFDLLFAFDTSLLEFVSISQGELLENCGWEYFQARVGSEADCGGQPCPKGTISLIGVADLASVPGSPSCYADTAGTLAQIEFLVSSDSAYDCVTTWMPWMWYDCGDNVVSSITGDSLYLSLGFHNDTIFPNELGTPPHCVTDTNTMFRRVSYHQGYVKFECLPPPPPPPDGVGDVNLNGIEFEISDWVLFAMYFYNGLDVFNVSYHAQIEASDVNLDGVPLTLQDLLYMHYHISAGSWWLQHHPPEPGDTVFFGQDTVAKTVSLSYPESLKAVYMVFEGDLRPWDWDSTNLPYDGQYTRVIIGAGMWPHGDTTIFEQDSLFFYTGEGTLVAAYAAFDGHTPIPTVIVGATGDCCQHKGNVDNDPSGELNIADLVYLIEYMFVDGPEPPCVRQADIIEDWSIDMADLVFLVDYMFNGGPPAAACP